MNGDVVGMLQSVVDSASGMPSKRVPSRPRCFAVGTEDVEVMRRTTLADGVNRELYLSSYRTFQHVNETFKGRSDRKALQDELLWASREYRRMLDDQLSSLYSIADVDSQYWAVASAVGAAEAMWHLLETLHLNGGPSVAAELATWARKQHRLNHDDEESLGPWERLREYIALGDIDGAEEILRETLFADAEMEGDAPRAREVLLGFLATIPQAGPSDSARNFLQRMEAWRREVLQEASTSSPDSLGLSRDLGGRDVDEFRRTLALLAGDREELRKTAARSSSWQVAVAGELILRTPFTSRMEFPTIVQSWVSEIEGSPLPATSPEMTILNVDEEGSIVRALRYMQVGFESAEKEQQLQFHWFFAHVTDLLHRRYADIGDAGHHRPFTAQTLLPGDVNLREYYTCEYVLHVLANADLWHIAAVYLKTCPNQEARGHPLLGTILTRIASRPGVSTERRVRKVVEVAEAAGSSMWWRKCAPHAARTGGRRDELGWHFSGCTVLVQSASAPPRLYGIFWKEATARRSTRSLIAFPVVIEERTKRMTC